MCSFQYVVIFYTALCKSLRHPAIFFFIQILWYIFVLNSALLSQCRNFTKPFPNFTFPKKNNLCLKNDCMLVKRATYYARDKKNTPCLIKQRKLYLGLPFKEEKKHSASLHKISTLFSCYCIFLLIRAFHFSIF